MPEGYAATKCRIGEDSAKDSDLFAETLNLYKDADEVIILAEASGGNAFYDRTVGDNVYDIVKAKDNTDYDGGLTAIEAASIESYIWNDENYNGIQDADEVGIATASVKLTRKYYDEDAKAWKQDDSFALVADGTPVATGTPIATGTPVATGTTPIATGTPTASASNGYYRFDNLPTYVEVDGKRYLAGYQMQLCEMPEGYAATKCRIGEDSAKDSDLFAETLNLYKDADEVIILAEASGGNAFYDRTVGDNVYDIVKAKDNTDYDGGLTAIETASIEGYIWNDENYNGIQDADEVGIATASVKLIRSYHDPHDTTWKLDDSFALVATGTPVATGTTPIATGTPTASASNGYYRFDNLPTYLEKNGQRYIVGYQMQLCEMPAGYAVTKYHASTDSSKDSDLIAGTLDLQKPDDFLILAKAFSGNTPYCYSVRGVDYDIVKAADITGYDGGIVQKDSKVSISGIVWDDADRDHEIGEDESGIANVKIILRQYYRRNGKWELLPDVKQTAYTDADGQYRFDDLPLSVTVDGMTCLAGYRLWIDSIPDGYNAEEYAGVSSGNVEIHTDERTLDGCIVLGIPEEKDITSGTCLDGFNTAKGEDAVSLNVYLNRNPEETTVTTTITSTTPTATETTTVPTKPTTQTSTATSTETTSATVSTSRTTTTTPTTVSTTKTQSSDIPTTPATTATTKQTTSSTTTSKQTTHTTTKTTATTVKTTTVSTTSTKTQTTTKTKTTTHTTKQTTLTTHTTYTTSRRTTSSTTSITTRKTSAVTSQTTRTTPTTTTKLTVVTTTTITTSTSVTTNPTTSLTTKQTTTTASSAGPIISVITTHTTIHTTQTTSKHTVPTTTSRTTASQTGTTSATTPQTSRTTYVTSTTTGTTTTKPSTQTTTNTATTVNTTCETSSTSTSIRQTTSRKNHTSVDTTTTTTTTANGIHAADHNKQTTTTTAASDVSAQTSVIKRNSALHRQNIPGTPKTGDTTLHITILIAACGFSLLLAILTKRRKK